MNLITFISMLSLVILVFALIRLNRHRSPINRSPEISPRRFDGLFAEQDKAEMRLLERAGSQLIAEEERKRLIQRASEGDLSALDVAYSNADIDHYHDVLNRLVDQAEGDSERLRSLVEYIVESRVLRASVRLSQMIIERWGNSLDRRSLHYMLCLSALSDDESTFLKAIDAALQQWRLGRLKLGSNKARIFESAYWLISEEVRNSGSGFVVKQAISGVRRELAAANRRSS